jgi:hypothetical protein
MFLLAFIEPPHADVIETIVRHRGLWQASGPKAHWVVAGLLDLDEACALTRLSVAGQRLHAPKPGVQI